MQAWRHFFVFRASTVLMKPATPAAVSRCPILVFKEPMPQKAFLAVRVRKAWVNAAISIGSPIGVPVPWASTYEIVSGSTPATSRASVMTRACPSTLGAVYPTLHGAVVVDRGALDNCVDVVPVSKGVGQTLQHDDTSPTPKDCALGLASKARQWPSGELISPSR